MKALRQNRLLYSLITAILMVVLFTPLYMYFSHDVAKLNQLYPHFIKSHDNYMEFEFRKERPSNWVPLYGISKYAKGAIILSEDWSFYQHEGFDLEQMKTALKEVFKEKRLRGASTITQQMVKNVFLSGDRTLWRKLHELILSQKVEKVLTKDKILEVYLNCIEFGPDIYGIRNASFHYFKKHPSALTPKEGAFLAMLLPSPKRYYVSFKNKKLTKFAQDRVQQILVKMRMGKIITPLQFTLESSSRLAWEKD